MMQKCWFKGVLTETFFWATNQRNMYIAQNKTMVLINQDMMYCFAQPLFVTLQVPQHNTVTRSMGNIKTNVKLRGQVLTPTVKFMRR